VKLIKSPPKKTKTVKEPKPVRRVLKKPPSEERVKNAVISHLSSKGYSHNLKIKANDQTGVDISAQHRDSPARRILVEAKGHSNAANKTNGICVAWGQLVSRVTSLNSNRIHALAFPSDWEHNVFRISSLPVAKALNVHYFFVDIDGNVAEFTANQFHKKHKRHKKTFKRSPSKKNEKKRN
jgi:hypothetical protein